MTDNTYQTNKSWVQSDLKTNAALDTPLVAIKPAPTFKTPDVKNDNQPAEQKERNSLDSLEELEKLIEEQHRELVSRGILPPDEIDFGLNSPLEPHLHTQSLNKKLFHDSQTAHGKPGDQPSYDRDCPSEIDELEQRAEASRLANLPEKPHEPPFSNNVMELDDQAAKVLPANLHSKPNHQWIHCFFSAPEILTC